ncbi:MAG: LCP family protein [Synergistes sp.]|nr:LCP family protein [Synergistes sp.]
MKKPLTYFLIVLCGLAALCGGAAARIYFAWHSTKEDIMTAFETETKNKTDDSYSELLKQQGKFNILLMGEDNVEGSRRSDTILFIAIDIDDKDIRVISLPRDTRVQIPRHGLQKLNHAFAYGGPDLMKATVEKYLEEPILYYVIVDYESFPEFIDMLGGVDIDIQKRMRYVDRAGKLDINFSPGRHHLDGKQALNYVRFRKDQLGDIGRIQRQQQFIKALIKKAYDPRVIVKFPELASQAMKIFRTDMPPTLAVQLAGFIQNEIGRDRMFFSMLPGDSVLIDKLSYWKGDLKAAKAFLNAPVATLISGDLKEGSGRNAKQVDFTTAGDGSDESYEDEPAPEKGAAQAGEKINTNKFVSSAPTREGIIELVKSMPESVAVLNGVGKSGVSAEVATRLQQLGVDVIHSGNAKHFDYRYSSVVYPTNAGEGVKLSAKKLGELLNIPKNLVRPSKQAFYASIIAGHDYAKLIKLLDDLLVVANSGNENGE